MSMKCPNCQSDLSKGIYKEIAVETCAKCQGMWFDTQEVDQLEDTVFDQDEFKGSMITNIRNGDKKCPKCEAKMKQFDYRWEDLILDFCPTGDGYWLDKEEEKKIIEIITQEAKDTGRKLSAERKWNTTLKGFQSPSFISKIKDMIGL